MSGGSWMARATFRISDGTGGQGYTPLSSDAPSVAVNGVTFGYDGAPVLSKIDLMVPRGELVAVIGPNGAGKSTLFKLLTGILRPARGEIRIFGQTIQAALASSRIAYMPQHEMLDWDYPVNVRDVVLAGRLGRIRRESGLRRYLPAGFAAEHHHAAVRQALEAVDLWALADRHISALSGGQRKRALLARALVQDAELLLLDEPLAGVDLATERLIHDVLQEARAEGRTIMMVSHDLSGSRDICDRVVLLNREVEADGPPAEVLSDARLAEFAAVGLKAISNRRAQP